MFGVLGHKDIRNGVIYDFDVRNSIDLYNFGIKNGMDFYHFGTKTGIYFL